MRATDTTGGRDESLFSVIIFVFVVYGIDAYFNNSKYTSALIHMTSDIVQRFR